MTPNHEFLPLGLPLLQPTVVPQLVPIHIRPHLSRAPNASPRPGAASPELADISPISPSLLFQPIPEEIEDIGTRYTVGEIDRVLDDIENGVRDPMLPLTTAEDVDLDMEDVIQGNLDGEFSNEEDLFD